MNGRVSERSYRGYRKISAVLKPLLARFVLALGQNGLWTARLRGLGCRNAHVGGSLKGGLCASRRSKRSKRASPATPARHAANLAHRQYLEGGNCLPQGLSASLSPMAGDSCTPASRAGVSLASEAQHLGLAVWRWSDHNDQSRSPGTDDLRLVDTIGKLSALYALADIAIVGGSLGSGRHGQNMLEAAAHSCATIVGMDTSNFPDAMALLRAANAIVESPADQLSSALAPLVADEATRKRLGEAGHRAWASARGASKRCERLLAAVPPSAQHTRSSDAS